MKEIKTLNLRRIVGEGDGRHGLTWAVWPTRDLNASANALNILDRHLEGGSQVSPGWYRVLAAVAVDGEVVWRDRFSLRVRIDDDGPGGEAPAQPPPTLQRA